MVTIFIFLFATLVFELYAAIAVKNLISNKWIFIAYLVINLSVVVTFFYIVFNFDRGSGVSKTILWAFGIFLLFFIPKVFSFTIMFLEDIYRLITAVVRFISDKLTTNEVETFFPTRRKFISQLALGISAIPFLGFLYGLTLGKFNYKVLKYAISFKDLPKEFDGFTITQISDIHCGSITDENKISYALDLVNKQKSDLILFTGDLVNNKADETLPWKEHLVKLDAPYGKYSILGNHDYGDYLHWENEEDKEKNFENVKKVHEEIGFRLLLNENEKISKNDEEISLVGVENWSRSFKKVGDLEKAAEGLTDKDFKIVLSHDPSHWEGEIRDHNKNFQLTLSGHTHGLQLGIEVPGFIKWSPIQYFYKHWAGLYEEVGRYINVNRGLGFHGYPGRVGIWPEITVIKLVKE